MCTPVVYIHKCLYLKSRSMTWFWYQIKAERVLLTMISNTHFYPKFRLFPVLWECIAYFVKGHLQVYKERVLLLKILLQLLTCKCSWIPKIKVWIKGLSLNKIAFFALLESLSQICNFWMLFNFVFIINVYYQFVVFMSGFKTFELGCCITDSNVLFVLLSVDVVFLLSIEVMSSREVNKNNFTGWAILSICAQKSRKIINWVGRLWFLSIPTQIIFPWKFWELLGMSLFQCYRWLQNTGFHAKA